MFSLLVPALLLAAPADPALTAARAVLDAQVAAWNQGDLEGYLQGYWQSPELRFVGSRGLVKGIDALREHYRKGRPDAAAFGHLAFSDVVLERVGDAIWVAGAYEVKGPKAGTGRFTLLMRAIPGQGWRVVYDHSS